jgi:Uncharacterized conserved protein (DUF2190)
MSDYTPVFKPGSSFTQTASASVVGGQVVMNSGNNTVAPATAASVKVVGVAAHDALAGARVTVIGGAGIIHETTGQGAITAGDLLQVGTVDGTVATLGATPVAGQSIGVALASAADGALVRWKSTR